jgi:hypothetical protein
MEGIEKKIIAAFESRFDQFEAKHDLQFKSFDARLKALEASVSGKLAKRVDAAVTASEEAKKCAKAASTKVDDLVDINLRSCPLKLDGVPKSCDAARVIAGLTSMLGFDSPQVMSHFKLNQIGDRPPTIVLQFSSDAVKSLFIDRYYLKKLKDTDVMKLYGTDRAGLKMYLAHDLVQTQYKIQKAARDHKKAGRLLSHFVKQGFIYVRFTAGGPQLRYDSVEDFEAAVKKYHVDKSSE